jgi:predicted TIM-barrel fold metal-dependent hydrolase
MGSIKAIDVLYSPGSVSRSADAPGVVACAEKPEDLLRRMDTAGVGQVLLAPCNRWQCDRHWLCGEVQSDDISLFIQGNNQRFAGLAGYNPFAITESLREVNRALHELDMRGVYLPTEGSDVSLLDRRLYPLYSRCVEIGVPVVVQVGTAGVAHPSELAEVIVDFPELDVVAGWTGPLDFDSIAWYARKSEHIWFAFAANDPAQEAKTAELLNSSIGHRCMWGSGGLPWKELLDRIHLFSLPQETLQSFLHDAAERLFRLSRPALALSRSEESIALAE